MGVAFPEDGRDEESAKVVSDPSDSVEEGVVGFDFVNSTSDSESESEVLRKLFTYSLGWLWVLFRQIDSWLLSLSLAGEGIHIYFILKSCTLSVYPATGSLHGRATLILSTHSFNKNITTNNYYLGPGRIHILFL